jgi:protein-disulfide isomerase
MSTLKPSVSSLDHFQGNENATLTMVEYGDYQCPHCGHAYPIIKKVQEYFGDNLKFIFRNFPLENIHPFAVPAAIATEAAAKQHKFWEMHDIIFENQATLHGHSFLQFAEALKLNIEQFKLDTENELVFSKVETDFESGIKSGVNGTPSIFINDIKYNGLVETQDLINALKSI